MNGRAIKIGARLFTALLLILLASEIGIPVGAAEVIPPAPKRYFNDYAGVTSVEVQQTLDRQLEALEKTNSTQVIVAIFKKMQSESSIEDYTVRVAQSWKVGTKEKSNGAVLFIFVEDRKMYLQVGYGLEGAIPDATAKDITENRIKPHFRNGDYNAGVTAGVSSIIQAVRGEYKGTGRTVTQQRQRKTQWVPFVLFLLFFLAIGSTRRRRGYVYGGRGRRGWGGPIIWTGGGGGWGGGGGGGGGWSGGFTGGGGGFGGGGAGSSW